MGRGKWTGGHRRTPRRTDSGVNSAIYSLSHLQEAGLVSRQRVESFKDDTDLADFTWEATWADRCGIHLDEALSASQGCVILIHGWDGSHVIWEDLASRICQENPRLIVLAPDVNGFGGSPFASEPPRLEFCDPASLIRSVELWIDLLGLRSGAKASRRLRVFTLVGHSMGGAATFYLNERQWRPHEVGRMAVAPALLTKDTLRKEFYKTLGLGIWAGSATMTLDWLKQRLAPRLIEALIGNASRTVKNEHLRIFGSTPKGVLAQTFFAMGAIPHPVRTRRWQHFRVMLGHRDRLVGAAPMLSHLEHLGFSSEDIRVVLGDHYMFSAGLQSRRLHGANREMLIRHILGLHDECVQAQRDQAQ